jgi:phosphonate transport system ATP-binding protein
MHNLDVARRYCPRIVGLKHGILTFDGASSALTDDVVTEILE